MGGATNQSIEMLLKAFAHYHYHISQLHHACSDHPAWDAVWSGRFEGINKLEQLAHICLCNGQSMGCVSGGGGFLQEVGVTDLKVGSSGREAATLAVQVGLPLKSNIMCSPCHIHVYFPLCLWR